MGILPVFQIELDVSLSKGGFWHTDYAQEKEHVEFVIQKGLPDLMRLQTLILNTGLVLPQPLHGNTALSLGQARR